MTLTIVIAVLLLLWFGLGCYVFFNACGPWKALDFLDEEAVKKTSYASCYPHIRESHDWLREKGARDVWTQSEDGLKLHAQWLPAKRPRGTILLIHGYHSSPFSDFGKVVGMYHDLGMNLLLPDQRCHGQSQGRFVTFGVKESGDMLCWLRFHNEVLSREKVILSGLSMGSATVMYMAGEKLPDNVAGIIADCGFTSPGEIIGKVFRDVTHLPPKPWIWSAELFARRLGGFSLWEKDACKTLAKNTLPILIVHGTADDFVPCEMGKRAYEACAGDKTLLLAEGAGHAKSFLVEQERYTALIHQLLDKTLGEMK